MRSWVVAVLAVGLLGLGGMAWVVGQLAIGRASEDACANRADDEGYQAWSDEITLVPPAHRCRLERPARAETPPSATVSIPTLAVARFGLTIVFPMVWLAGTTVGVVLIRRRTSNAGVVAP